jgi:hypothetical protein
MKIEISCKGNSELDISEMREFQGNLKSLSEESYVKLKGQIIDNGFSFPIAVWKDKNSYYIIDGHQRKRVLERLREEGWEVPYVPIVSIKADSYRQAKMKLLAAASQYGKIEDQGLYEFLSEANLDIDELMESLRLPEINFDSFKNNFFDVENKEDDFVFNEKNNNESENKHFHLNIVFENENEQQELFTELRDRGFNVKV